MIVVIVIIIFVIIVIVNIIINIAFLLRFFFVAYIVFAEFEFAAAYVKKNIGIRMFICDETGAQKVIKDILLKKKEWEKRFNL